MLKRVAGTRSAEAKVRREMQEEQAKQEGEAAGGRPGEEGCGEGGRLGSGKQRRPKSPF